jgi:type IV pilus assembly protein PilX
MTRASEMNRPLHSIPHRLTSSQGRQTGASLIIVLMILVIVSILGVGGAQIVSMAERGSRNDRDMQLAWQASEAALLDAQLDIDGPDGASARKKGITDGTSLFVAGCGTDTDAKGLCALALTGKPAWLTVNMTDAARTAELGLYTTGSFASGTTGPQSIQKPRYVIEPIPDPGATRDRSAAPSTFLYRVTSMGFGPRADIQAVTQMIYRK